jgi:AraC family transcriptional regulator
MNRRHPQVVRQAMKYIHAHLERKLSLKEVAEAVAFSPYHFHRLFVRQTGETLHTYVLRVRLEEAARQLLEYRDASVMEIAARTGFSGPPAFSRAFRAHFGMPPSEYRSKEGTPSYGEKEDFVYGAEEISFEVTLHNLPLLQVAYKRVKGVRGGTFDVKVAEAFADVSAWWDKHSHGKTGGPYILASVEENWSLPQAERTYDVCVAIPPFFRTSLHKFPLKELDGGLFAVCRIKKSGDMPLVFAEAIREATWASEYMYDHWIPDNGYLLDSRPGLHLFYTEPGKPEVVMECCLPVILSDERRARNGK